MTPTVSAVIDRLLELKQYADTGARTLGNYRSQGLGQHYLHDISIRLTTLIQETKNELHLSNHDLTDSDPDSSGHGQQLELPFFQTSNNGKDSGEFEFGAPI